MNTYKKTLNIVSLLLAMFILTISIEAATPKSENYSEVVQNLKNLYDTDKKFQELLDNALSSAIPTPDGWAVDPENSNILYKIIPIIFLTLAKILTGASIHHHT